MVMAAGLGTRMRPLTNHRPKALVEVAGRPLIDHVLDRLAAAGIRRAVVNVHAFADDLERHLARRTDLEILISDERSELLETGGGLAKARPLLGDAPILVANIDTLWTDDHLIDNLVAAWDGARMDDLLLVVPQTHAQGFDGPGDFFIDAAGALTHRRDRPSAPVVYMGLHMLSPALIDAWPASPHGIFQHWMDYAGAGRLHGVVAEGLWMHVGDPAALALAEARLSPPPLGEGDRAAVEGARGRFSFSQAQRRAGSPSPPTARSSATWRPGSGAPWARRRLRPWPTPPSCCPTAGPCAPWPRPWSPHPASGRSCCRTCAPWATSTRASRRSRPASWPWTCRRRSAPRAGASSWPGSSPPTRT